MMDVFQLNDDEFMDAWTLAAKRLEDAKAEVKEFASAFNDRLLAAEVERAAEKQRAVEAGEVDPSLDQIVGSVEN